VAIVCGCVDSSDIRQIWIIEYDMTADDDYVWNLPGPYRRVLEERGGILALLADERLEHENPNPLTKTFGCAISHCSRLSWPTRR
jgi:hypothetical protein